MKDITRVEFPYDQREFTQAQCDEIIAAQFVHPIFERHETPVEFEPDEKEGKFKLKNYRSEMIVDLNKIETVKVTIIARLSLTRDLEVATEERPPSFNDAVNVAVPSNNLMGIRQIQVYIDFCTEELQIKLNEGWAILAICPQPDQRRPDYIMGKVG
jgi:hypothetical protein